MDENTNAGRLFALFGGLNRLAGRLSLDKSVLSRWNSRGARGGYGKVPTEYNAAIKNTAAQWAAGLPGEEAMEFLGLVESCLDQHACPACGSPLEPGQTIDVAKLRKIVRKRK